MLNQDFNLGLLPRSCRVLDLTTEMGWLCGKILGDIGADVIKIEPPGGDLGRNIGPFYKDSVDREKSLYWFAYNTSKRGITLNIETADGKEIFRKLAKDVDFIIESFEPGYLNELGLGYQDLEAINSRVIMVSITPFGSSGPYAHFKASDITLEALGGFLYLCGEPGRPPVRISLRQAYPAGSLHAAMGAMIAYYYRESTGEGQHVDVSIQQCVIRFMMNMVEMWDVCRVNTRRSGPFFVVDRDAPLGSLGNRHFWSCKDGYIVFIPRGGGNKGLVASASALVELANSEGMAMGLKDFDWSKFEEATVSQEEYDRIEDNLAKFFLTKTKQELFEAAIQKGIQIAPLNSVKDIVEDKQLKARDYFARVEHPELEDTILYPGAPLRLSSNSWNIRQRAPLIGEHNVDIFEKELNISREQMAMLKSANII